MQVGDLVKFKENGMYGIVVKLTRCDLPPRGNGYTIAWADGYTGMRWADDLELVNASR